MQLMLGKYERIRQHTFSLWFHFHVAAMILLSYAKWNCNLLCLVERCLPQCNLFLLWCIDITCTNIGLGCLSIPRLLFLSNSLHLKRFPFPPQQQNHKTVWNGFCIISNFLTSAEIFAPDRGLTPLGFSCPFCLVSMTKVVFPNVKMYFCELYFHLLGLGYLYS